MSVFSLSKFVFSVTPLHLAVKKEHIETAEILLLFGAELNASTTGDQTLLMMAVRNDKVEMMRLLLDSNADTTKIDRYGSNVSQTENKEIKQLFLEHSTKSVRRGFVCFVFGC